MALIAPILVVIGLMMADGCGGGGGGSSSAAAARPPTPQGYAAIGFNTAQLLSPGAPLYKNVFLNVVAVRMNPSTNADVSEFSPHWVSINVPPATGVNIATGSINTGLGFGGLFFGGTAQALIGQGRAELQIDMTALQNVAQIFNVQPIIPNTYHQFEVILDPLAPGDVVPTCSGVLGEGCITYTAVLDPSLPSRILKFSLPTGYTVAKQLLSPAILSLNVNVGPPPLGSTGAVTILPAINSIITANSDSLPPTALAGTLSGTVEFSSGETFATSTHPVTITAERAGTNQIVESAPLPPSCNGKKTCGFNLFLPASASIGTLYDIYASSKETTFAVSSGQLVVSGQTNTNLVSTPLQIKTQPSVFFSGAVTDACSGAAATAISAATLQILAPETSGIDCGVIPTPAGCVSVASASTDEAGFFPMPGNGFTPAPFNQLPLEKDLTLLVSAAGFSPFTAPLVPTPSNFKCPGVNKATVCTLSLAHGTLQGTINVQIPPNASPTLPQVNVLVMAEDSGTNNIENVQMVTIPAGANSTTQIPFSLNVPLSTTTPAATLDVFATAQDVFNGVPQTTTGHTYGVASAIPNSAAACGDPPVVVTNPLTIECVGHGSLFGGVSGVGADTSLILSKEDSRTGDYVAVQTTNIAPPPSSTSGSYAICAPPDVYQLTAYNSGAAGTSVPAAVSSPVPVSPAPTPCPQICDSGQGSACLVCNSTQGPNVVAP